MKDLPTSLPDGLCIGAVTEREDPRDVLITKEPWGVTELPQGGVIASSSIRRKAQVLAVRPDLHVVEIRGNLDTRLRKLGEHGDWHATILAAAGLNRLGLREQWPRYYWQPLGHRIMIPAVGQGAIACEIRADDPVTSAIISSIDHPSARACTLAERAFLRAWGGGCQVPLAAHATVANQNLKLVAAVFDLDGRNMKRTTVTGSPSDAPVLGERAATVLR
jgi:hydroxymethylbilane synthase